MKLLIVRPQPGADATAALAQRMGISAVVIPLFAIQPLRWSVPDAGEYDALMFTSANAPRHGGGGLSALHHLPAYAAGSATADAARAAGFGVIWTGTKGADAVIGQAEMDRNFRLLWLTGYHHHDVVLPSNMSVEPMPVYESARLSAPQTLIENLSHPQITALHSVRAAQYFRGICDDHGVDKSKIALVSLSREISDSAGAGWAERLVADTPNDNALLLQAKSYFTNMRHSP
jgi:uroporphyrinogen-III synthase